MKNQRGNIGDMTNTLKTTPQGDRRANNYSCWKSDERARLDALEGAIRAVAATEAAS
jgi:hypothetical protein